MGRNAHTFTPGHSKVGGRTKGGPNTRPSVVALIQAAVGQMPERERQEVIRMIRKKIKTGDGRMWDLTAAYLDGKPVQRVQVETPQPLTIQITMPDGSTRALGDQGGPGALPSAPR